MAFRISWAVPLPVSLRVGRILELEEAHMVTCPLHKPTGGHVCSLHAQVRRSQLHGGTEVLQAAPQLRRSALWHHDEPLITLGHSKHR